MESFSSIKKASKVLTSVRAYKGDAMTLLAFDLDESLIANFVGFSIRVTQGNREPYYLRNRLSFDPAILAKNDIDNKEKLSSLYSPFQKFRWVHVPSSEHFVDNPFFGKYTYDVTPRFLVNDILQELDPGLTVSVAIDVSPFKDGDIKVGFTRAFISSTAYADHFNNNSHLRPNDDDLLFDIKQKSGSAKRWHEAIRKMVETDYTFEEQHEYLGWQARDRIMEFLDEALDDGGVNLDVFAYDLNEPVVAQKLLELAKQGRLRIILDNSSTHAKADCFEEKFEKQFRAVATGQSKILRGRYQALAHSKVFIQRKGGNAQKVLTGSTNFTTNGMYINANHVIVFENAKVAQLYADVFEKSFSSQLMKDFKTTTYAGKDFLFQDPQLPDMTIRFAPHPASFATQFFADISTRIKDAKSDVLFAIMDDDSKSSILDAVREQVKSDAVFTYGITDNTKDTYLYKPNSKRGVKVAGRGTETALPPPFDKVATIPGHNIHHKFVVVDFKGRDSVVYCGSSNLAFNPEQNNGDNLLEIRDEDVVTAFAIEAIRLVDHFHWRNKKTVVAKNNETLTLNDNTDKKNRWYTSYYNPQDLHYVERTLLIREKTNSGN